MLAALPEVIEAVDPTVFAAGRSRADKTGTVEDVVGARIVVSVVVFEWKGAWGAC